jgi:hypothetical protein
MLTSAGAAARERDSTKAARSNTIFFMEILLPMIGIIYQSGRSGMNAVRIRK